MNRRSPPLSRFTRNRKIPPLRATKSAVLPSVAVRTVARMSTSTPSWIAIFEKSAVVPSCPVPFTVGVVKCSRTVSVVSACDVTAKPNHIMDANANVTPVAPGSERRGLKMSWNRSIALMAGNLVD